MKNIKDKIIGFIVGGIIFGSIGAFAYSYQAGDISYRTSHNNQVSNVEAAINDLYVKLQSCYEIYEVADIIYFDPVNNHSCTTYTSSNSLNETKTGCLKWYVIKDNGTSIDVILDHNTTAIQQWYSSDINVSYTSSLVKSVVDLLTAPTTTSGGSGWNSNLNPRLIKASEVHILTDGPSTWNVNDYSTYYYFGSKNSNNYSQQTSIEKNIQRSFHWLFDYTNGCTNYGCSVSDNSNYGYWTSTTVGTAGSGSNIWVIIDQGALGYGYGNASNLYRGIRPVITINKSNL